MTVAICSIEGCNKPILSRGWCNKHYIRWRKYGDPETLLAKRNQYSDVNPEDRFWRKVNKTETCWLWTAGVSAKEAVTSRVNVLRGDTIARKNALKTHCIRGHELSESNLRKRVDGKRDCIPCIKERVSSQL